MEYQGIRYELLQTASPARWKWVVHISRFRQITGVSLSREIATRAAIRAIETTKRAIEEALKAEEKRQGEPF